MIPKFTGNVDASGVLSIVDSQYLNYKAHLTSLANKTVEITVKPFKKFASDPQRKYYWGVLVKILAKELGYTQDAMHNALKIEFLSYEDNGLTFVQSTQKLNTAEREEYHEDIRNWAMSFHGIYLPLPNEVDL